MNRIRMQTINIWHEDLNDMFYLNFFKILKELIIQNMSKFDFFIKDTKTLNILDNCSLT